MHYRVKVLVMLLLLSVFSSTTLAQADEEDDAQTPKFDIEYSEAPKPKHIVRPKFPAEAKELGIGGDVVLLVYIDSKGTVRNAIIQYSPGLESMEKNALEAVYQCEFYPAEQDGKPVGVWYTVVMEYENDSPLIQTIPNRKFPREIVFNGNFKKGKSYYDKEDYDNALGYFGKALIDEPKSGYGRYMYANTLLRLGEIKGAIEWYDEAREYIGGTDKETRVNISCGKGVALIALSKYEEAIEELTKATNIDPNKGEAWKEKGFAYLKLYEFDEANECYEEALACEPKNALFHYDFARCLYCSGKTDEALNTLGKAINYDPDIAEIARKESFFENLEDDPGFRKLIGSE